MKHCKIAIDTFNNTKIGDKKFTDFISIRGNKLNVDIQDGPISTFGINGIQVTDLLEFTKELYKSLNNDFPCRENALTITKIEEAIHWQEARTKDRLNRSVEGSNKI